MMRLGDLALAGRGNELFEELDRVALGSNEAIPVIRALQRRFAPARWSARSGRAGQERSMPS
jgi:hypothetical protein